MCRRRAVRQGAERETGKGEMERVGGGLFSTAGERREGRAAVGCGGVDRETYKDLEPSDARGRRDR